MNLNSKHQRVERGTHRSRLMHELVVVFKREFVIGFRQGWRWYWLSALVLLPVAILYALCLR